MSKEKDRENKGEIKIGSDLQLGTCQGPRPIQHPNTWISFHKIQNYGYY